MELCLQRRGCSEFRRGDHATTFGGSALACAAALANIEVIRKEKLVKRSQDMEIILSIN